MTASTNEAQLLALPHLLLMRNEYVGTPSDNEDPVYFGFEVIINVNSSPLFNGEIERFINDIGATYDEVNSRAQILQGFQYELQKYFKFDSFLFCRLSA